MNSKMSWKLFELNLIQHSGHEARRNFHFLSIDEIKKLNEKKVNLNEEIKMEMKLSWVEVKLKQQQTTKKNEETNSWTTCYMKFN